MNTVEVKHIRKAFGPNLAVEDVSFEVQPGEIFGILGPNGAGKTTSIRVMLDIFKPDAGEVTIFGGSIDEASKNRIGYLPEERGLYKDQKLETVLLYFAQLKGLDQATARQRLTPWLEKFDLIDHRQKKVQELSKGMQQKAQIITTLLHDPDLIIMDEPLSGLDPVNTRLAKSVLRELSAAGKTLIMSTHQMYQVEALCDRIVLIHEGNVVLYGNVQEIKRNFAGNAVVLKGDVDTTSLAGVLEERRQNGEIHLVLESGTNPQEIWRQLAAQPQARISRFQIDEPSLDDIFISVVQETKGA